MNIIFLGDIVGRPGREAVERQLSTLKTKYEADFVIANVENAAHGKGVTYNTLNQILESGVDFFTSGNHVWKKEGRKILSDNQLPLIRPYNYPKGVIGKGYEVINVLTKRVAVINLIGRTFFRFHYDCPFRAADEILEELKNKNLDYIIVDFHCEATSEVKALGYYLDGRVSAVLGTHTHIQTADEEIFEKGTAYISDAGMCGDKDTILGKDKQEVIEGFLKQDSVESNWYSDWKRGTVQGVVLTLDRKLKVKKIKRISEIIINN
jgi:hypothetical protein